jgi:serine-type D-Ala-D-Ala carboxypeptidase (penicillin-binding protein 5/6)
VRWASAVRAALAALCVCALAVACAGSAVARPGGGRGLTGAGGVGGAGGAGGTGAVARPPALSARAAVLISADTGQRLYGVDPDARLPIASTTKLMTALVTLEQVHRLSRTFKQNDYTAASIDSQIGLSPGERMTVRDLLVALLLPSADDAAEDLAFNVGGGSVTRFVAMMNDRAAQLGLNHTHYATPSGLDTAGNYSSPEDLAQLARFLLARHPFFARTVARAGATIHMAQGTRQVANRNDLIGRVPWMRGVKTGHTLDAGYVLVGAGRRHGMTLISVVLGTPSQGDRDASTLALLGYGFAHFRLATPVLAGTVLAKPAVKYRDGTHANLVAAQDFSRVVPVGAPLATRVQAPRQLSGPLRRGTEAGHVLVLSQGRVIARIPLQLAKGLQAVSPLAIAARFLIRPITLLVLLALIGALLGIRWVWRERARGGESPRLEAA